MADPVLPPVRAVFRAIARTVVPEAAELDAAAWTELERIVEVVAFVVALAAAVAIAYAIWLGLMSLAFWFVAVENLSILFDALYESARFPVTAYPGAIRFVLTYLVPMAWITTVPAGALTGRVGPGFALVSALVAAAALALTRLLWRVALRRYTSAGG